MSTEEDLEVTTYLLKQKDPVGRSSLSLAASEGHTSLIDLLLDKGAVLEDTDKEGLTALGWACVRGRLNAAQCLIDRGADVNTCDKTGRTPLDLAAFQVIIPLRIVGCRGPRVASPTDKRGRLSIFAYSWVGRGLADRSNEALEG
jgi:ankyrin repeat protein